MSAGVLMPECLRQHWTCQNSTCGTGHFNIENDDTNKNREHKGDKEEDNGKCNLIVSRTEELDFIFKHRISSTGPKSTERVRSYKLFFLWRNTRVAGFPFDTKILY